MQYALVILLLPLLNFLVTGLMDTRWKARVAGTISTVAIAVITLLSYVTAYEYFTTRFQDGSYQAFIPFELNWLRFTDTLQVQLGLLLDPISVMMLVVVTTVSLMVHLYSLSYMKGERGFERYYAFLSLFTFSMLGLVVATNIFQMYIFWELVGVSSYLLIGFYYTRPAAVAAAKKAFIVTRFADLFFLAGILLLSYYTQTFDFTALTSGDGRMFGTISSLTFMGGSVLSWAMALIFIGGAGKSALFPLHIWLPDAMEGPTPVSALIHAATMVVAGVYLVARLFPVYAVQTPEVLHGIAYTGLFTALFSAVIACVQTDIKRVLAFSTISQIGFMMVGLGVSGYGAHEGLGYMASLFHLFTHAMFKALLFLGAGSVIHAVHSNSMDDMGQLRKRMPVTHLTFLVACLAIAGIPPFSGFFSKDEILAAAFHFSPPVGWILSGIAGLTAFYMFRLYYNIFWNDKPPTSRHAEHPVHESPALMTLPLIVLALITLVAGFIPFGQFVTSDRGLYTISLDWQVAASSILIALAGIGLATVLYRRNNDKPARLKLKFAGLHEAATHRFYIDEIYLFLTKKVVFNSISRPLAWFDRHIVDGFMNLLAMVSNRVSVRIKGIQSGHIQQYAWVFLFATLAIAGILLFVV